MKGSAMQYLVGAIMIAFSIYQAYMEELWEFALYATAGCAFLTMGLIKNEQYLISKQFMTVLSWVLIIAAAFLFFFMVRTDLG
ncbi:MAG: hypothetical protein R3345_00620 [Fulvivirga sp.]|nr:hypothetical protein [Fulvivirga sp.]